MDAKRQLEFRIAIDIRLILFQVSNNSNWKAWFSSMKTKKEAQ
jgi:hypothetical protein